jgi:hypothetical protein
MHTTVQSGRCCWNRYVSGPFGTGGITTGSGCGPHVIPLASTNTVNQHITRMAHHTIVGMAITSMSCVQVTVPAAQVAWKMAVCLSFVSRLLTITLSAG